MVSGCQPLLICSVLVSLANWEFSLCRFPARPGQLLFCPATVPSSNSSVCYFAQLCFAFVCFHSSLVLIYYWLSSVSVFWLCYCFRGLFTLVILIFGSFNWFDYILVHWLGYSLRFFILVDCWLCSLSWAECWIVGGLSTSHCCMNRSPETLVLIVPCDEDCCVAPVVSSGSTPRHHSV